MLRNDSPLASSLRFGIALRAASENADRAALLLQRGQLSRTLDAGTSSRQTARGFRPVPLELRALPAVLTAGAGRYAAALRPSLPSET